MAKSKKKAPARTSARKAAPARKGGRRTPAKSAAKKVARKSARKATRRPPARPPAKAKATRAKATRAKAATAKAAPPKKAPAKKASAKAPIDAPRRRAPSLDRERRTIREEEPVPGPPSSLDMDRSASSARSGRHELAQRLRQHTSTGPAMTGGDVDGDWEDAESVGDEAPGGDNPTPDQDIVEEIGEAIGITYEDNEELKGGDELAERDRHRWELDPASREDLDEE